MLSKRWKWTWSSQYYSLEWKSSSEASSQIFLTGLQSLGFSWCGISITQETDCQFWIIISEALSGGKMSSSCYPNIKVWLWFPCKMANLVFSSMIFRELVFVVRYFLSYFHLPGMRRSLSTGHSLLLFSMTFFIFPWHQRLMINTYSYQSFFKVYSCNRSLTNGLTFGALLFLLQIELTDAWLVIQKSTFLSNGCGIQLIRKFFFWLVLRDRLNTRAMLRRRHMHLPDYHCVLCHCNVDEDLAHLLFHCPFAAACWTCCFI